MSYYDRRGVGGVPKPLISVWMRWGNLLCNDNLVSYIDECYYGVDDVIDFYYDSTEKSDKSYGIELGIAVLIHKMNIISNNIKL